jgi:hypothetical protein
MTGQWGPWTLASELPKWKNWADYRSFQYTWLPCGKTVAYRFRSVDPAPLPEGVDA